MGMRDIIDNAILKSYNQGVYDALIEGVRTDCGYHYNKGYAFGYEIKCELYERQVC